MNEKMSRLLGQSVNLYPHRTDILYPHIVEKISILWGTVGMPRYFEELLFNDRGSRQGFPSDVMSEIFALSNHHDAAQPSRAALESAWHDSSALDRLERFKDK